MPLTNDPISDVVQLTKNAGTLIDNISWHERHARELMLSGGKQERIAVLNSQITQFMTDAANVINDAKRTIEFAQSELKKADPNHPSLELLQQKLSHIDKLSSKLDHMRERILSRIKAPKNDPLLETIKDAPKPSTIDPNMNSKIQNLISQMFDENGILQDRSVHKTLLKIDVKEKHFFLNELAKKVLSSEHAQLNAAKTMEQMSVPILLADRKMFIDELRKENKERAIEILKNTNVPNTPLPTQKYSQDDMLYTKPVAVEPPKDEAKEAFQKRVMEAVDAGFGKGKEGFAKIKEEIGKLPKEERLDFIVAVREEVERRKIEKAFNEVKVPDHEPENQTRFRR